MDIKESNYNSHGQEKPMQKRINHNTKNKFK